jgi:hypothetical protein
MANPKSVKYITKSTVIKRGWSDKLVAEFLGEPDREVPNPHYASGPPMKLYDEARVIRIEETEAFQTASASLKRHQAARTAGAAKAVATKQQKTLALVEKTVITVTVIERSELVRRAREHQRSRQAGREYRRALRGDVGGSSGEHDDWYDDYVPTAEERAAQEEEFEQRITVNYIRHQLTQYDEHCRRLVKLVGKEAGYRLLRSRVFVAIREAYPWLATECDRQEEERKADGA